MLVKYCVLSTRLEYYQSKYGYCRPVSINYYYCVNVINYKFVIVIYEAR